MRAQQIAVGLVPGQPRTTRRGPCPGGAFKNGGLPVGAEMVGMFLRLWHHRAGSSLIEYSILVAIIVAAIIAGVAAAGSAASGISVHLLNILG